MSSLIDGIFGFSATVLVLRLGVPAFEQGGLGEALSAQTPFYLLYGLGFLQTVGTWSVLRRLSQWTIGLDYYATVLALITLMMWVTLPFTVNVLAEAVGDRADVSSALRLMASTLFVSAVAYGSLFWWLTRRRWFREGLDARILAAARLASYTLFLWPVVVFALTYLNPWAALSVYVGASLLSIVPLDAMSTEQYDALDA